MEVGETVGEELIVYNKKKLYNSENNHEQSFAKMET